MISALVDQTDLRRSAHGARPRAPEPTTTIYGPLHRCRPIGAATYAIRIAYPLSWEMPLHRLNEGGDYDADVALDGPPPWPSTPVQMLRKHYWEVVDRETAERYWAIRPYSFALCRK